MWDEEDGFFYDVLQLPNGQAQRLKVRSMVGLLPLCAVTVFEGELRDKISRSSCNDSNGFSQRARNWSPSSMIRKRIGHAGRRLGAILDETKLRRVLAKMLDENEFLGAHGLRALSRYHADHPYVFRVGDQEYRVSYVPGESDTGMFGGNSNWRGPIWMPVNALIIRALLQYYAYYGNEFTVECPTGSGRQMNLYQVAEEITRRLAGIFLEGQGRPPAREWRRAEISGRSALARLHPVLRILPRRYRRRRWREPPDRVDRSHRPRDAPVRNAHAGQSPRRRHEKPMFEKATALSAEN